MKTNTPPSNYKGYRFPPKIISNAVWLYFRFSLSFRDVEELLAQRGVVVSYETVRQWYLKFGQRYASELRLRRPRCGDKWHMDEVFLTIHGERHSLWRAVDQSGCHLLIWCTAFLLRTGAEVHNQVLFSFLSRLWFYLTFCSHPFYHRRRW